MQEIVSEIFGIIRDCPELKGLWPANTPKDTIFFIEFCLVTGRLIPEYDESGHIQGFLFFSRSHYKEGIDYKRPDDGGKYVICPLLWVRPDKRKSGIIKRLIEKALNEGKDIYSGAEFLIYERMEKINHYRMIDFSKFRRRFLNGQRRRNRSYTATTVYATD